MTRLLEEQYRFPFGDTIKVIISSINGFILEVRNFNTLLLKSLKGTFTDENLIDNTIKKIDGMLIHKELMKTLHSRGMSPNWIKMIVNQNDCCIWLRNIDGMYVLLSEELLNLMDIENGYNPLGKRPDEVSNYVKNKDLKEGLRQCHISDLEVKRVGSSTISKNDDCTIVKYGIKNKSNELVAIFGILIPIIDDSDELIFKDKKFLEHFQEAIITNDFSLRTE